MYVCTPSRYKILLRLCVFLNTPTELYISNKLTLLNVRFHQINGAILSTHSGRVMHIFVSKLTTIGPDYGMSPGRRQAVIWTNDGILLIGPLGINFSEILVEIYGLSFKKMHLEMSSGNWQPFCLGLNVLSCLERSPALDISQVETAAVSMVWR